MQRFIKYIPDSDMAKYLHKKPIANHLANIISARARRSDCPFTGLKTGQCFLGDTKEIGITPKQYRTAKKLLEKIGFATFKGTNKGTTATLVSVDVYDINAKLKGEQEGNLEDNLEGNLEDNLEGNQGANKGRQTKKDKKDNNDKKEKKYIFLEQFQKIQKGELLRKTQLDINFHFGLFPNSWTNNFKNEVLSMWRYLESKEYKPEYWGNIGTITTQISIIRSSLNEFTEEEIIKGFQSCKFASKKSWNMYLKKIEQPTEQTKYTPIYTLPQFKDNNHRWRYFLARLEKYRPHLDNRKYNTEYRHRAIYKRDAEALCYELEQQNPQLAQIQIQFK